MGERCYICKKIKDESVVICIGDAHNNGIEYICDDCNICDDDFTDLEILENSLESKDLKFDMKR